MLRYLGLDLGGTNIKAAVIGMVTDGSVRVVATREVPTHAQRGADAVVGRLIEVGRDVLAESGPVRAAGIGVPGICHHETGTVVKLANLPGSWKGQPLRGHLAGALDVPVTVINDAGAFTLAEGLMGAGRGCRTLVGVVLGTGVGGGIMIEGRLHVGSGGIAGEIGHQTVLPDGPRCGCGNRGCVEPLTKADTLVRLANRATVEEVYAGARAGDQQCRDAVQTVAGYLGIALANCVTLLGPDRIVVGGGISMAGELALGPIREAVRARVSVVPADRIDIVVAALGTSAGAIGAALAATGECTLPYTDALT